MYIPSFLYILSSQLEAPQSVRISFQKGCVFCMFAISQWRARGQMSVQNESSQVLDSQKWQRDQNVRLQSLGALNLNEMKNTHFLHFLKRLKRGSSPLDQGSNA